MSPFHQNRNVPYSGSPRGGRIGKDIVEPQRGGSSRSAAASARGQAEAGACRPTAGDQLSTSEAGLEALSGGRSRGFKAPWGWEEQQSSQGREVSPASAGAGASQVQRRDRRAVWSDAGGGAPGK